MEFHVRVNVDNAAFKTGDGSELARLLRELADELEHVQPKSITLRDVNGNVVGYAQFGTPRKRS